MFDEQCGVPGKILNTTATNVVSSGSGTSATSISCGFSASAASAKGLPGWRVAITHFSGASSCSASYTVESPAGTVLWRMDLANTNNGFVQNFDPPIMSGSANAAVVFKAQNLGSTNTAGVNGTGYQIFNTG